MVEVVDHDFGIDGMFDGGVVNLLDRPFVSDEVIMLMVVRQKGFDQVD